MDDQSKANWYFPLIKGIIMILLAIMIFSNPGGVLVAWAFYIGIGFVFSGMVFIYHGFAGRGEHENWSWRVFEGLLDMFIGFMLITNPLLTASILPFFIGLWGAFYGIAMFIDAFSHEEGEIVKLTSSVVIFWISSLIMFNPVMFGLTITIWVGIIFMVTGVFNMIKSFSLKKKAAKLDRLEE